MARIRSAGLIADLLIGKRVVESFRHGKTSLCKSGAICNPSHSWLVAVSVRLGKTSGLCVFTSFPAILDDLLHNGNGPPDGHEHSHVAGC